ncbi:MAG TPA: hypothetical protein VKB93_00405 [Thermoanaerobaculia bacterium]|nr:hypothetical protein [Thermoanaerobaculia bacterium]
MQPAVTPPPPPTPPPAERPRSRMSLKFLIVLVLLLAVAFFVGYAPPAIQARNLSRTLNATQFELRLANLERRLGVAAMEAQRNNYANATAGAREFFDGCAALAQSESFAEEPRTKNAIASYAAQRDEVMTQLANADPLVKERLASMYLAVDGVFTRRQ